MVLKKNEKKALLEICQKMSDLFWGPTLEQGENLSQNSFWLPIEKILPRLDSPSVQAYDNIKATLNTFPTGQALFDGLEEEYVRLFISARRGIRTPLYASCHAEINLGERPPLMGEPALAMQIRFQSKGLALADDIGEPPDHLSIELEYLYFLLNKGWADHDNELLDEASSFAVDFMLPWVMRLQQGLAVEENAGRFYPFVVTLLIAIIRFIGKIKPGE